MIANCAYIQLMKAIKSPSELQQKQRCIQKYVATKRANKSNWERQMDRELENYLNFALANEVNNSTGQHMLTVKIIQITIWHFKIK